MNYVRHWRVWRKVNMVERKDILAMLLLAVDKRVISWYRFSLVLEDLLTVALEAKGEALGGYEGAQEERGEGE
jgi:hypothetical protein